MTQEAIQEIIRKQRNYFYTGATLNIDFRITALKKLQTSIQSHQEQINAALKSDLGKSSFESYMCESGLVLSEITYMLKHIRSLSREKTVHTPLAQFHSRSYRKPSPYGVTLIMSPWNYPFLLTFDPLVDAIAAGNTAVLKPSAYSPATSNIICEIVRECFPEEYVAVVMGGRQENSCLLQEHFDYIFFTGSQAVGKEVMRHASEHLTPVTLELGGKSPCIVDKSANIKLAAKRIVFGKYLNCGQTCVAPDYIYCHREVKDTLLKQIQKQIRKQFGKSPLDNKNYGKIINEKHFSRCRVGSDRDVVHIAQSCDRVDIRLVLRVGHRIAEKQHQIHFVAGNAGSDLLYAAQLAGEITMHRQTGGLRQHPSGSTGGNDYIFGKDRAVGSAELKREFLAGIVCKNGNRHSVLSFVLSIVLWVADSFETK